MDGFIKKALKFIDKMTRPTRNSQDNVSNLA